MRSLPKQQRFARQTTVRASSASRREQLQKEERRRRHAKEENKPDALGAILSRPLSLALSAALALSPLPPAPLSLPLLSVAPAHAQGIPKIDSITVPPSDGTLQIKFLASPDPKVREAQTALVEAWGHVSTNYFDHGFGGVDWRRALQEALDESFESSSSSPSASPASSSSSSSTSASSPSSNPALEKTYDALDSMLGKLGDPYTRFLRPADAGAYAAGAEGEGLSLGIQLQKRASGGEGARADEGDGGGAVVVAAVVPGSPADGAGVSRGDVLVAIDGKSARGRPIEDLALSLAREADVTLFTPTSTRKSGESDVGRRRTVHLKPASVSLHAVQWARLKTAQEAAEEAAAQEAAAQGASAQEASAQEASAVTTEATASTAEATAATSAAAEREAKKSSSRVSYLRVAAFNRLAPADVSRALDALFSSSESASGSEGGGEKNGDDVLLVDLRDNGGGAVDAGVDVASQLLPETASKGGKTTQPPPSFFFGSVRDAVGNEERVAIDGSKGKLPASSPSRRTRVAVLVNGGTASTSELVAAALRGEANPSPSSSASSSSSSSSSPSAFVSSDALLVGESTFKKARTQRAVPLTGGGLLLVSNLQYVSPRGEAVDGVGLTPDVLCKPDKVEQSFFVSGIGGGGDDESDEEKNAAVLARDLLFDPCVRVAAEALGAPLADPPPGTQ